MLYKASKLFLTICMWLYKFVGNLGKHARIDKQKDVHLTANEALKQKMRAY